MSNGMMNVRVDVGADKVSDKTRSNRAEVVRSMATETPLYKTDPTFKEAVDKLVQAGVDLAAAEAHVTQLEAALVKARSSRDVRRNAYDKAYGLCSTNAENHSTKAEDIHGFGFALLTRTAQAFGPPINIEAKYDAIKEVLRIHVLYTSGHPALSRCHLALGADQEPRS